MTRTIIGQQKIVQSFIQSYIAIQTWWTLRAVGKGPVTQWGQHVNALTSFIEFLRIDALDGTQR
jgi:hypothetical protein